MENPWREWSAVRVAVWQLNRFDKFAQSCVSPLPCIFGEILSPSLQSGNDPGRSTSTMSGN